MSAGAAQNLCSSLRIDCALLWVGESGNFFPWTVNSQLNICILKVFNQPLKRYFKIALNHFLVVSVTGTQILLFVRFLCVTFSSEIVVSLPFCQGSSLQATSKYLSGML